jgi:hypothetical protein
MVMAATSVVIEVGVLMSRLSPHGEPKEKSPQSDNEEKRNPAAHKKGVKIVCQKQTQNSLIAKSSLKVEQDDNKS